MRSRKKEEQSSPKQQETVKKELPSYAQWVLLFALFMTYLLGSWGNLSKSEKNESPKAAESRITISKQVEKMASMQIKRGEKLLAQKQSKASKNWIAY